MLIFKCDSSIAITDMLLNLSELMKRERIGCKEGAICNETDGRILYYSFTGNGDLVAEAFREKGAETRRVTPR